jgi:nitronate monooxygenase
MIGSEHPIIQAPMANAGGVDLCVAAIEGGALGSLPCGMLSATQIREQVEAVRSRVTGPLNLNFFCHQMPAGFDDSAWRQLLQPYYEELQPAGGRPAPARLPFDEAACAAVEQLRPDVASFHFGLPDAALLERVKASGAVVIASATTVEEAKWLERKGADAVIAQGFEAGGHTGRFFGSSPAEALGLFALLPQLVDAVGVPVIAAGAIADGRGIAAAMMLGASAAQIGTAYLLSPESLIRPEQRELLAARPTVMTNVYSGGLARAASGRLIHELGPVRAEAPPYPLASPAIAPLARAAQQRGEHDFLLPLAGQGAPIAAQMPAAELTRKLAAEALALIGRLIDA